MKIQAKILSGFGVVLTILALAGAGAYAGFSVVQGGISEYGHATQGADIGARLGSEFLKLRGHAGDFEASGLPADADAFAGRQTRTREILERAKAHFADPALRAQVDRAGTALDAYGAVFGKAKALRTGHDVLVRTKLVPLGEKIMAELDGATEMALGENNDEALLLIQSAREHFLRFRVYLLSMMGERGEKAEHHAKLAQASFGRAMSAMTGIRESLEEGQRTVFAKSEAFAAEYGKVFETIRGDELQLQKLFHGELPEKAEIIMETIEALKTALSGREEALKRKIDQAIVRTELITASSSILGILIGIACALAIGGAISRPIVEMTDRMDALAHGDLDVAVSGLGRRDEIGSMASAVQVFKENAQKVERMTADLREKEQQAQAEVVRANRAVAESTALAESLKDMVGHIRNTSGNISSAVSQVSSGGQDLSERSEKQASTLEETAASMEELTSTVKQNADNAQQANQLAARAREVAVKGGAIVTDTVTAMKGIDESSKKISDIVGVIDDIAFQTNLLALNAAVEAARAGEAGKGFAVVASEVRNLAQRSADSSREIQALISDSGGQVQNGVDLVNRTGETLEEIVGAIKNVADIVAEIAAASAEQSQGLDEINSAVAQMDDMTQRNAAMVQEFASAARSMQQEVDTLLDLVQGKSRGGSSDALQTSRATKARSAEQGQKSVPPRANRRSTETPLGQAANGSGAQPAPTVGSATGTHDDEWETF